MKKFNVEKDIYAIITDKIIAKIEEGFIPWKKPWMSKGAASNFVTKKPYRGINSLLLNSDERTPYYLTFNQASALGGKIKKGAKAEMIVYWNFVYISKESGKQVKPEANKYPAGEIIKKAFLKYYNVFNIEDTENIPYTSPEPLQRTEKEKIEICEQIIQNYPGSPKIDFGGNRACYTPLKDIVRMPFIEDFEQSESYYSVLFHELIHSTGHQTRLNREGIATISGFGTEDYSKEELVAELGAAFLCGVSSIIPTTLNLSAAYIQNWLQILKNDKKFIIEAAQKAQKATDHILNTESISSSEEEGE